MSKAKSHPRWKKSASARVEAAAAPLGWRTSDDDEIALRRRRAGAERVRVENLDPREPVFSTFRVHSASGAEYTVEIRSLTELENSCSCPDFRANGLGTCKHVEAVLARVGRRKRAATRPRPARTDIYLRRGGGGDPEVAVTGPARRAGRAGDILRRYFGDDGRLRGDPAEAVQSLAREVEASPPAVRHGVRISRELLAWAEDRARRAAREVERQAFLADLRAGLAVLPELKHELYPYQIEGMLHLAFGERALLADDMGLGKTIQAIAACALLRKLRGVERVLVVCPVSLKAEWEEQIEHFTDLSARAVYGGKPERLAAYDRPPFFTIANYEQAVRDVADLNGRLRPDIVILDEAQRIKNWSTRTARTLKRLESRFAFLLTGTPIENRIDEIYSIVEYLDPHVFGALFRFNREFYELDERGRPVGYRNLEELQRRIRPLVLRRRKDQIESQLPARVDNNYFVPLSPAQREMYEEYEARVARLVAVAKRRPLTRDEQDKLQKWLACMRMICDTVYILSPRNRDCPKLHELEAVLRDLDVAGARKAIVFSEWQRMLELVRELAVRMGLDFAWHTGEVPQQKRREEIRRFKTDPACRLLLSTDSGGVGLNLQAASVVINMDLPWNPARLEQRIARAWRKHQTQNVHVINLVSENTIEHRMLATLAAKRSLADAVLDGRADVREVRMPTAARQGFLDRLAGLLASRLQPAAAPAEPLPASPRERLRAMAVEILGAEPVEIRLAKGGSGDTAVLVVAGATSAEATARLAAEWRRAVGSGPGPRKVEVVDAATWEVIQRLALGGVLQLRDGTAEDAAGADEHRRERVTALREQALRRAKMASVLAAADLADEATAPVADAVELALRAAAVAEGCWEPDDSRPIPADLLRGEFARGGLLDAVQIALVDRLRHEPDGADIVAACALVNSLSAAR
jgi:hypothetical protein